MNSRHEDGASTSALHQSAPLLQALLASSADMITVSNRDGRITYASPATQRVSGYSVEEFLERHPFETIHPEDRAACADAFARLLTTPGLSLDLQHRVWHKDGSWRWVEGTFTSLFDDPTVQGVVATIRDITVRKRYELNAAFLADLGEEFARLSSAEDIMRAAGEKLKRYFSGARLAFIEIDEAADQAAIVYDNSEPELIQMLGTRPLSQYVSPEFLREFKAGQPIAINDVQTDPRTAALAPAYLALSIGAQLLAPYVSDGQVDLVIALRHPQPYVWRSDEIELAQELAARVYLRLERARAEAALRRERAWLEAILQQLPEGVIIAEAPSGKLLLGNQQVQRIWRHEFIASDNIDQYQAYKGFHRDGRPYLPQEWPLARAISSGEHVDREEIRVQRGDGSFGWIESSAVPIAAGDGSIIAAVVTFSDITQRKQTEQALRESEERFRHLSESGLISVAFFDVGGAITDANEAFLTMIGYSRAELRQGLVRWDRLTPPEWIARTRQALDEFRRSGRITPYEKEYFRHDGSRFWGLFGGAKLNDQGEGVAFVLDISERKRAEDVLRESEARFRAVADLVPDLLWSNDPQGATEWYNQRWLAYTGQTLERALGDGWLDAVHPDDRDLARLRFQHAIDTGQPLRQEQRIGSATGEYRWFLVQARPLSNSAGQIVRWYGAATDIHQERLALAAEQAARAQTEAALIDAQLARAEAEAALQTRDQFLSIASHELRTPLTSILGYTDLLQTRSRRQDTSSTERILTMISRQGQRLNSLIEQLLDVSRLQQGQFMIRRQLVDLAAVVAQVVDEQRAAQPLDSRHAIVFEQADQPLLVSGDGPRLEQVIQNLLSNALKYSPHGGLVRVRVRRAANEAVLEVVDQGIGIPAEAQAHLFDAFYRASNVGTLVSGFGLGLHIVREIVQRHDGRIELASSEGVGSTFRVVLPLETAGD